MKKLMLFVAIMATVLLSSCHRGLNSSDVEEGDTLKMKYASLLQMVKYPHYTVVSVKNPWHGDEMLQTYILIDRKDSASVAHVPMGTIVYVPVRKATVFTTAHCQLLEYLGASDQINGVADLKYILIPDIHRRVKVGKITDVGDGMDPMIEKIIDSRPEAMIISPFENSGGFGKLEDIQIPIIQAADYMETSALGRAEWMKFYGLLFGKEKTSDSLFHVVDSTYQKLKNKAKKMSEGRSILTERKTGNVWYCPGGLSSLGVLIADAHAKYAFAKDTHSGSLPLSFEQVLDKAGNADVWAFKFNGAKPMNKADLLSEYHGYSGLKAFRTGEIYECNCTTTPYFEEVSFRPDFLLREMIQILHPHENLGGLKYYHKLNE